MALIHGQLLAPSGILSSSSNYSMKDSIEVCPSSPSPFNASSSRPTYWFWNTSNNRPLLSVGLLYCILTALLGTAAIIRRRHSRSFFFIPSRFSGNFSSSPFVSSSPPSPFFRYRLLIASPCSSPLLMLQTRLCR